MTPRHRLGSSLAGDTKSATDGTEISVREYSESRVAVGLFLAPARSPAVPVKATDMLEEEVLLATGLESLAPAEMEHATGRSHCGILLHAAATMPRR